MAFILMLDDGYSIGPFSSEAEAVRADIKKMATDPATLEPYKTQAKLLLSGITPPTGYLGPVPSDWAYEQAKALVVEVDHIIFEFIPKIGPHSTTFDLYWEAIFGEFRLHNHVDWIDSTMPK